MNRDRIINSLTSNKPTLLNIVWLIATICLLWGFVGQANELSDTRHKLDSLKHARAQQPDKTAQTCRTYGDWSAGQTKTIDVTVGAAQRHAIVHLPSSYTPGKYLPVVFMFAGKGNDALKAQTAYNIDSMPAVIVYAEPTMGTEGVPAWDGAPYAPNPHTDISYTKSVLRALRTDLCINRNKVYAVGFSNGGGFAAMMSCQAPGELAAIAIVSGALYAPESNCQPTVPVPILNIHGDHDQVIPYTGAGHRGLPPIDAWMAMRAANAGCETAPQVLPLDAFATDTLWSKCKAGIHIENIRVHGGIHGWGSVPDDAIWQFLQQFSLPSQI